ncbi:MAG: helix-hairpin-helix domain-containing protein [Planctomycetota bacterium]
MSVGLLGVHLVRAFPTPPDPIAPEASVYRVDINRADAATLELLPGIGPSIAQNIIQSRENHGFFHRPTDLERVRNIGPATRQRLTPWIMLPADPLSTTDNPPAAEAPLTPLEPSPPGPADTAPRIQRPSRQ